MTNMHKIIIILYIIIFSFTGTGLFAQEQAQEQKKEEKINLEVLSDNAQFEYASHLYRLNRYEKALQLFTEYLEIYYNGLHRKEAYKNIASIYFREFDYIKSIKVYRSLYEEFSNSEEGIEGLFMTGICYQKMGFHGKAREVFQSVIDDHPGSNFAYQAKIKLDVIEILEKG
jgi:TolA-binding protein